MKNTPVPLAMITTFTLGLCGCERAPTEAEQAAKKAAEFEKAINAKFAEIDAAAAAQMEAEKKLIQMNPR
jgi:hypothetical protein